MSTRQTQGTWEFRALSRRAESPVRQVDIAARIGTSQMNVSNWQTGKRRPNAFFREKIFRAYGISPSAWFTPEESASLDVLGAATEAA